MKKTFKILLTSLLIFCALETSAQAPIIKFGVIADIQYADADTKRDNFYRHSIQKLDTAIAHFNAEAVDFSITLGDMIDRNPSDMDLIMKQLEGLKKRVYNIPGNHDYSGVVDNNMMFKKLKMPAEYYTFGQKKWRFIMLNTNEVASYANIEASNKEKELAAIKDTIEVRGGANAHPWNGGISNMQMLWLLDELTRAEKKGENVIVCTHHPLYPASELTALNDVEILETLSQFKNVKLILSGHDHKGGFGIFKHIPCVTIEGMLETEVNAYGTVELYEDKIEIKGEGRLTSRTITF